MDRLHVVLVALLGVVSCSHDWISGSALEMTVRQGDNITLYCDCKLSSGVFIAWYRNCSHSNQPPLIIEIKFDQSAYNMTIFPRFQFVRNFSSESYDLLITDITVSDEGLYYCGTKEIKVEDKDYITQGNIYNYGNITTRILVNSSDPRHSDTPPDCAVCWILLFSLCPACAALSSLLSSLLVHHLCQKKATEPQADQQRPQTRLEQDEDVCYAALEIRQTSQTKKKKSQSSDFSTYSAINTSRM